MIKKLSKLIKLTISNFKRTDFQHVCEKYPESEFVGNNNFKSKIKIL